MNKTINFLTTSTLSILAMQFCVSESKPAMAQTYNESTKTEFLAQGTSTDDETNGDFTEEDEIKKEAPYNDSADTEEFYEEGASADDEANSTETDNSENDDVTVEDEIEKEAPYNDSADTEEFYEEGASAEDKAGKSKSNGDRTKSDDELNSDDTKVDRELETEDETNPSRGLNSEDMKVDGELETEAGTFKQDSTEKPRIEDVRQPDVGEDNLPAEPPVNEAEVEF